MIQCSGFSHTHHPQKRGKREEKEKGIKEKDAS